MLLFQKRKFNGVRAVIFDMDGTLIDSMALYYDIIRDIMGWLRIEAELSQEYLFETLSEGKRLSDIIFSPDLKDRESVVVQFNRMAMDAFKDVFERGDVELIDGVEVLLEELRRRGFSLAIVTSSMTEIVVPFLKAKHLAPYLECVLGRDEVPRLKPSPDPLLKCVAILNVEPSEAVYVGDSVVDIQAGKAAGTGTVGVLTGTAVLDRLRAEGPDVILDSVGDLMAVL